MVKSTAEADALISLWEKLDAPGAEGRPCDAELRRKRALVITNHEHISMCFTLAEWPRPEGCTNNYEGSQSLWSAVERYVITPEQARDIAVPAHRHSNAVRARWIEHYDNRLAYERAMLEEQGGYEEKKAPRRSALPLLNYDGEVTWRSRYRGGEVVTTMAVGITKAQWAAIPDDYKGTVTSECGTHRVRQTMAAPGQPRHQLVIVFLTDSKKHPRPAPEKVQEKAAEEAAAREEAMAAELLRRQARATTREREPEDPDAAAFEQLAQAAKAGVKVVTAPQLFPTPPDIARRMVDELGGTMAGKRVLEPSAGTGNLIRAIVNSALGFDCGVRIVAVEQNVELCRMLEEQRRRTLYATEANFEVRCEDFLACGEELGTFDAVVMNPPFVNGIDIKHIRHAAGMLKPGGVLVALCAGGPRQREQLEPLAELWEELPAGSFQEVGTNVNVALLVIRK